MARTEKILKETMNGLIKGLSFTTETKEHFDGKWLPTLDISLAIDGSNQTEFKFFEKGMATNLTIQSRSAMGENMKYQSL